MEKIMVLLLFFFIPCPMFCRTVPHYVIKKPGDPAPLQKMGRRLGQDYQPYKEIMDENVLAQEQFKRIKQKELEGRISYEASRKSIITRTFSD